MLLLLLGDEMAFFGLFGLFRLLMFSFATTKSQRVRAGGEKYKKRTLPSSLHLSAAESVSSNVATLRHHYRPAPDMTDTLNDDGLGR